MSLQKQSVRSLLWMLPTIFGVSASAVVFFSPDLSNMRWWGFKLFLMKSVGYCLLLHLGILLWFLVRRAWLRCLGASLLLLFVFWAALMAAFVSGPDIEAVRLKVAEATGVCASNLVCNGGRLSRESVVVFEVKGVTSSKIIGEDVNRQDDTTWEIVLHALSFVHVRIPANARVEIRRWHDKFNTVFMVDVQGKQYAIFLGNR